VLSVGRLFYHSNRNMLKIEGKVSRISYIITFPSIKVDFSVSNCAHR